MKVRRFEIGALGTNCYIAGDKNVVVIDPADNAKGIAKYLERENLVLEAILVTHGHFDHVGALRELREVTNAPVYMHRDDIDMLGDRMKSLGFMTGETPEKCEIDCVLDGGEELVFGGDSLRVMHTPGHSMGSVSYIGDDCVFSGDLVFKGSIGRYDYGDYTTELDSIQRLFGELDDKCVIFPGHGEETTVEFERENNPYIR